MSVEPTIRRNSEESSVSSSSNGLPELGLERELSHMGMSLAGDTEKQSLSYAEIQDALEKVREAQFQDQKAGAGVLYDVIDPEGEIKSINRGYPDGRIRESKMSEEFRKEMEEYTSDHFDELVDKYIANYGSKVNTDFARELFPGYEHNRTVFNASLDKLAVKVKEAANARLLEDPNLKKVSFVVGPPAAGKSRFMASNEWKEFQGKVAQNNLGLTLNFFSGVSGKKQDIPEKIQDTIIQDRTLSEEFSKLQSSLKETLGLKKKVNMIFIYKDPERAVLGNLARGESTGRCVTLGDMARINVRSLKNFLEIHREFPSIPLAMSYEKADSSRDIFYGRKAISAAKKMLSSIGSEKEVLDRIKKVINNEYDERIDKGDPVPQAIIEQISGTRKMEDILCKDIESLMRKVDVKLKEKYGDSVVRKFITNSKEDEHLRVVGKAIAKGTYYTIIEGEVGKKSARKSTHDSGGSMQASLIPLYCVSNRAVRNVKEGRLSFTLHPGGVLKSPKGFDLDAQVRGRQAPHPTAIGTLTSRSRQGHSPTR